MNDPKRAPLPRKTFTTLAFILFLAAASQSWAETVSIYGPRTFTKGKGAPETYSDAFPPTAGLSSLQLIVHSKGAKKGSAAKATVSLNGAAIVGPSDLQARGISRKGLRYGLEPLNILEIAFHDADKAAVTIEIVGETEERMILQPAPGL